MSLTKIGHLWVYEDWPKWDPIFKTIAEGYVWKPDISWTGRMELSNRNLEGPCLSSA